MTVFAMGYLLALVLIVGEFIGVLAQGGSSVTGKRLSLPLLVMVLSGVVLALGQF